MERSEEYEPIILNLQKSQSVKQVKRKRYVAMIVVSVVMLGAAATFAALYYPKTLTNRRSTEVSTPVPKPIRTVSVTSTPATAVKPPEPTRSEPTPTPTVLPIPVVTEVMGMLNLYSRPANAEVVIDGKSLGYTPLFNYELAPGTYTVKFSHQGTISEHKITITAGETTEYTHRFEGFGSLNIKTTRSGSDIYVNGDLAGQSPLLLEGLLPGTYKIVARKRGYATAEKTVTLEKEEHQEVLLTIKRLDLITDPDQKSSPTPSSRPLHPSERQGS
jgi:hypothetical protein